MTTTVVDPSRSGGIYRFLRSIPTWVLWILVLVWLTPTLGLLINSFRDRSAQTTSGWWTVFLGNWDGFTLNNYKEVLDPGLTGGMRWRVSIRSKLWSHSSRDMPCALISATPWQAVQV